MSVEYVLLLGIAIAPHGIFSAQGLSENMEILNAKSHIDSYTTGCTQGTHKVPH